MTAEPASFAFSAAAQREWLTPSGFALLRAAVEDGHGLGEGLAHEVARALRGWGRSRGATHVAFLVHPLTGGPREYRLELPRLTGADLVGGARAAAGARITWDPASPAFIRVDGRGAVLCVPSVLASSAGEALDNRLPLMRSEDALATAAARALRVLGDETGRRVQATVALTRAFALVDAEPHLPRTRADRVSACVIAAERELDRVAAGVRIGHDELTVLPAATGLASDRLRLALEVLADVAPRYGLVLQEGAAGPDAWSLMAGPHANLLAPGTTPRAHLRFTFFAAAVVRAFAAHGELVGTLDLGPDLHAVLGALARGELFAGSDEERACGAPSLPRIGGRATPYGFTGAGFALGDLDLFAATVVNTIVAGAITEQTRALEAWTTAGEDREPAVREVVADAYRRYRHARDEARGGNAAWTADVVTRGRAARRGEGAWRADLAAPAADGAPWPAGLAAATPAPDAAARVFAEQGVMSARELATRRAARLEEEARVAVERARVYVTPAAILRRAQLSPPRGPENRRRAAELDDALRTVQATSRALDAVVAAGRTDGVPPLLEDLRAAAARLTR
jgi:glutamine synthetase